MSFTRNTLLASIFAIGTLAVVAHDAQACPPGRSGGYSRGYSSRSYSRPSYNSYSTPSYQNYAQPTYNSYSQPVQVIRQVQPTQTIQPQTIVRQQTQIQPVSQTQQLAPQQQIAQQPQPQVTPQQQPLRQVTPQQQITQRQSQPVAPQQPQSAPAAMSALQALGGFAPPQTAAPQPQQQVQTPAHVGNWNASLGNGAKVQLNLQADGSFSWTATSQNGGTSSFSGTYTVSNGSLNLNRSNDNQQLGGSMTISGNNAFSFKVAGNNAASINFNRI